MSASVEKLKAARERVARPNGWTQRTCARDSQGEITHSTNVYAVCWCSVGAIIAVGGSSKEIAMIKHVVNPNSLAEWNDEPYRTQAEVVAAFDSAIALAEAQS